MAIELSEFCQENLGLLTDEDPETRSVMSLLVGAVWPLNADADVLLARYAVEMDPRVKACVAQALVRYVGRLNGRQADVMARDINALLHGASRESLARANMELADVWWTDEERTRLAARISIPVVRDPPAMASRGDLACGLRFKSNVTGRRSGGLSVRRSRSWSTGTSMRRAETKSSRASRPRPVRLTSWSVRLWGTASDS
jgi:hypothetical protein